MENIELTENQIVERIEITRTYMNKIKLVYKLVKVFSLLIYAGIIAPVWWILQSAGWDVTNVIGFFALIFVTVKIISHIGCGVLDFFHDTFTLQRDGELLILDLKIISKMNKEKIAKINKENNNVD